MLVFFTMSTTFELPDKREIEEFLFEGTTLGDYVNLQTTQNPERYGGPIFHTQSTVARILKVARKDARFVGKHIQIRPIGERRDPLSSEQLRLLVKEELHKVLDSEELKALGVA